MTTHTALIPMMVSIVVACTPNERAPRRDGDVAVRPVLVDASAAELAREIEQADRRGTWSEVKQRWQGQRMTWTVTRQRVLCQVASSCYVAAFPIQRPAQQGWLPKLELTAGELAKLETSCGAAEQCEVTFEGTLSDLALSAELPTSVRFADVRIVGARKV